MSKARQLHSTDAKRNAKCSVSASHYTSQRIGRLLTKLAHGEDGLTKQTDTGKKEKERERKMTLKE